MEVSIFKFLFRYYGICLNAKASFSHNDARENFKFLRTCTFKFAEDNVDMVCHGRIIYVRDTGGTLLPYFTPSKVVQNAKCIDYEEDDFEDDSIDVPEVTVEELDKIPTYKLKCLLSKYKRYYSFYRRLKKELEKRGVYENKQYKIDKEMEKIEESEYDDKYQRRRKIKCKKP